MRSPRHARWLLAAALLVGAGLSSTVRADIIVPRPKPEPKPPKPQPPLPPEPKPIPDDDGVSRSAVIASAAASLGVTLLGVWTIRRQLRRPKAVSQLV